MFIRHWLMDRSDKSIPTQYIDVCSYIPSFFLLPLAAMIMVSQTIYGALKFFFSTIFFHIGRPIGQSTDDLRKNIFRLCGNYEKVRRNEARWIGLWILPAAILVVMAIRNVLRICSVDGGQVTTPFDIASAIIFFILSGLAIILGFMLAVAILYWVVAICVAVGLGIWGTPLKVGENEKPEFLDIIRMRIHSFKEKHCARLLLVSPGNE